MVDPRSERAPSLAREREGGERVGRRRRGGNKVGLSSISCVLDLAVWCLNLQECNQSWEQLVGVRWRRESNQSTSRTKKSKLILIFDSDSLRNLESSSLSSITHSTLLRSKPVKHTSRICLQLIDLRGHRLKEKKDYRTRKCIHLEISLLTPN